MLPSFNLHSSFISISFISILQQYTCITDIAVQHASPNPFSLGDHASYVPAQAHQYPAHAAKPQKLKSYKTPFQPAGTSQYTAMAMMTKAGWIQYMPPPGILNAQGSALRFRQGRTLSNGGGILHGRERRLGGYSGATRRKLCHNNDNVSKWRLYYQSLNILSAMHYSRLSIESMCSLLHSKNLNANCMIMSGARAREGDEEAADPISHAAVRACAFPWSATGQAFFCQMQDPCATPCGWRVAAVSWQSRRPSACCRRVTWTPSTGPAPPKERCQDERAWGQWHYQQLGSWLKPRSSMQRPPAAAPDHSAESPPWAWQTAFPCRRPSWPPSAPPPDNQYTWLHSPCPSC